LSFDSFIIQEFHTPSASSLYRLRHLLSTQTRPAWTASVSSHLSGTATARALSFGPYL